MAQLSDIVQKIFITVFGDDAAQRKFKQKIDEAKSSVDDLSGSADSGGKTLEDYGKSATTSAGDHDQLAGAVKGVASELSGAEGALTSATSGHQNLASATNESRSATEQHTSVLNAMKIGLTSVVPEFDKMSKAQREVSTSADDLERAHIHVADAQIKLNKVFQDGEATTHDIRKAMLDLKGAEESVVTKTEDHSKALKDVEKGANEAEKATGGLATAFGLLGSAGKGAASGFDGLTASMNILKGPAIILGVNLLVSAVSALGGAAFSVISAMGPLVGLLGALPGAAIGLASVFGTVKLAFGDVGKAMKAYDASQTGSAATTASTAKAVAAAAETVRTATRARDKAIESSADANTRAEEAIVTAHKNAAKAVRDAADAIEAANKKVTDSYTGIGEAAVKAAEMNAQAAQNVTHAEEALTQAQERAKQTQLDLSAARKDAAEQLQQLAFQARGAALSEESAQIRLIEAQKNYDLVMSSRASTDLDKRKAALSLKEAQLGLAEAQDHNTDTAAKLTTENAKGVEGSDQVVSALKNQTAANKGVTDATTALGKAKADQTKTAAEATKLQKEAQDKYAESLKSLAKINVDSADKVATANKAEEDSIKARDKTARDGADSVSEAARNLTKALQDQATVASTGATSANKYKEALAKLSPEARTFVAQLQATQKTFEGVKAQAGIGLFPGLTTALKEVTPFFPVLSGVLKETGQALGSIAVQAGKLVGSSEFGKGIAQVAHTNALAFRELGGQVGPEGKASSGLIGLIDAFRHIAVEAQPLIKWISELINHFGLFADRSVIAGQESGKLAAFFEKAKATAITLAHIIRDLGMGLYNMGKASADTGRGFLASLEKMMAKFREFTGSFEGQNKLRAFFESTAGPMRALGNLIGDLAGGLVSMANPGKLTPLIDAIDKQLLPPLLKIMNSMSDSNLGQQLINLLEQVLKIASQFAGASGPLSTYLTTITELTKIVNWAIEHIPGMKEFFFILTTGLAAKSAGSTLISPLLGLQKEIKGTTGLLGGLGNAFNIGKQTEAGLAPVEGVMAKFGKNVGDKLKGILQEVGLFGGKAAKEAAESLAKETVGSVKDAAQGKVGEAVVDKAASLGKASSSAPITAAHTAQAEAAQSAAAAEGELAAATGVGAVAAGEAAVAEGVLTGATEASAIGAETATGAFATMWAAITGPVGLIIAGIVAVGVAAVLLYQHFKPFHELIDQIWQGLQVMWDKVMEVVGGIVNFVRDHWKLLGEIMLGPLGLVIAQWDNIKTGISAAVGWIIGFVQDHWQLLVGILIAPFSPVLALAWLFRDQIVAAFVAVKDAVVAAWDATWAAVAAVWNSVGKPIFDGIVFVIEKVLVPIVKTALGIIVGFWIDMFEISKHVVEAGLTVIRVLFETAWAVISAVFSAAWTVITAIVQGGWDALQKVWDQTGSPLFGLITTGLGLLQTAFSFVWDLIGKIVGGAWGILQSLWDGPGQALFSAIGFGLDTLRGVFDRIWGIIGSIVGQVFTGFGEAWGAIEWVWVKITNVFTTLQGIVETVMHAIGKVLADTWNAIPALWDASLGKVMTGMKTAFEWVRDTGVSIWQGLANAVSHAFDGVVDTVKKALGPVLHFLGTLVGAVSSILGAVGLNNMAKPLRDASDSLKGFAAGGTLPVSKKVPGVAAGGRAPYGDAPMVEVGPGFITSRARAIVGEGSPNHPEYVIPTDPKYRKRATQLYLSLGHDLKLMAEGGRVPRRLADNGQTRPRAEGEQVPRRMADGGQIPRPTEGEQASWLMAEGGQIPMLGLGDIVGGAVHGVGSGLSAVGGAIGGAVTGVVGGVIDISKTAVGDLVGLGQDAWREGTGLIRKGAASALEHIWPTFPTTGNAIVDVAPGGLNTARTAATNWIRGREAPAAPGTGMARGGVVATHGPISRAGRRAPRGLSAQIPAYRAGGLLTRIPRYEDGGLPPSAAPADDPVMTRMLALQARMFQLQMSKMDALRSSGGGAGQFMKLVELQAALLSAMRQTTDAIKGPVVATQEGTSAATTDVQSATTQLETALVAKQIEQTTATTALQSAVTTKQDDQTAAAATQAAATIAKQGEIKAAADQQIVTTQTQADAANVSATQAQTDAAAQLAAQGATQSAVVKGIADLAAVVSGALPTLTAIVDAINGAKGSIDALLAPLTGVGTKLDTLGTSVTALQSSVDTLPSKMPQPSAGGGGGSGSVGGSGGGGGSVAVPSAATRPITPASAPAPAPAPAVKTPGDWPGNKANAADVKTTQQFLNDKGASPKLTVDGVWGPKTQTAWNDWVRRQNDIAMTNADNAAYYGKDLGNITSGLQPVKKPATQHADIPVASYYGAAAGVALGKSVGQPIGIGGGFVTSTPTAIVGEGSPSHPEYVIPTDPRYRPRARRLFEQLGGQLRLMADGGQLGQRPKPRLMAEGGALGTPTFDSVGDLGLRAAIRAAFDALGTLMSGSLQAVTDSLMTVQIHLADLGDKLKTLIQASPVTGALDSVSTTLAAALATGVGNITAGLTTLDTDLGGKLDAVKSAVDAKAGAAAAGPAVAAVPVAATTPASRVAAVPVAATLTPASRVASTPLATAVAAARTVATPGAAVPTPAIRVASTPLATAITAARTVAAPQVDRTAVRVVSTPLATATATARTVATPAPIPAPAVNKADRTAVRAVQTKLNTAGARLVVDGLWGPKTQGAWQQFGHDAKFYATGGALPGTGAGARAGALPGEGLAGVKLAGVNLGSPVRVGAGMVVNKPQAIVGEGNPAFPEFVIPTDPQYRSRAKTLFAQLRKQLRMMADGGVVGGGTGDTSAASDAPTASDLRASDLSVKVALRAAFDAMASTIQNALQAVSDGLGTVHIDVQQVLGGVKDVPGPIQDKVTTFSSDLQSKLVEQITLVTTGLGTLDTGLGTKVDAVTQKLTDSFAPLQGSVDFVKATFDALNKFTTDNLLPALIGDTGSVKGAIDALVAPLGAINDKLTTLGTTVGTLQSSIDTLPSKMPTPSSGGGGGGGAGVGGVPAIATKPVAPAPAPALSPTTVGNIGAPATPGAWPGNKSNKADVSQTQQFLNDKGASPKLTVDGLWGPKTQAAWDDWVRKTNNPTVARINTNNAISNQMSAPPGPPKATRDYSVGVGGLDYFAAASGATLGAASGTALGSTNATPTGKIAQAALAIATASPRKIAAGFVTNGPKAIVGEGNPAWPEYVVPTDPKYRPRAADLFKKLGRNLNLLAEGGTVSGSSDIPASDAPTAQDLRSSNLVLRSVLRDAFDALSTKFDAALQTVSDGLLNVGIGLSAVTDAVKAIAGPIASHLDSFASGLQDKLTEQVTLITTGIATLQSDAGLKIDAVTQKLVDSFAPLQLSVDLMKVAVDALNTFTTAALLPALIGESGSIKGSVDALATPLSGLSGKLDTIAGNVTSLQSSVASIPSGGGGGGGGSVGGGGGSSFTSPAIAPPPPPVATAPAIPAAAPGANLAFKPGEPQAILNALPPVDTSWDWWTGDRKDKVQVKGLQTFLDITPPVPNPLLVVDGIWGPKTQTAYEKQAKAAMALPPAQRPRLPVTSGGSHASLLAAGGSIAVGAGFMTDGPQAVVGEGNPAFPEYVIPTDPKYRKKATGLYASLAKDLGVTVMASGGVLGIDGASSAAGNLAADLSEQTRETNAELRRQTAILENLVDAVKGIKTTGGKGATFQPGAIQVDAKLADVADSLSRKLQILATVGAFGGDL